MSIEADLVAQQGQESDSPTGNPGQEADDSQLSITDQILKAAEKEEPAPSEEVSEKKKGEEAPKEEPKEAEKPAPYDQDPKWKAARAAQKSLDEILERAELESIEDLMEAVESGKTMKEILGSDDLKQLKKDQARLKEIEDFWESDRLRKLEEEEEPDETKERLKREIKELKEERVREKSEAEEAYKVRSSLDNYTTVANKSVTDAGLTGEDAEMAKLFLGVGNPFNEIDITDKKTVKESNMSGAKRFKSYLDGIRQKAIDDYAGGKSEMIPVTKIEAPVIEKPSGESKVETMDEANESAKAELRQLIGELAKSG